jgi:hypothetical protein
LFTCAQNATPEHAPFLASLKNCAKFYDAELVIIKSRYKNPTSIWSEDQKSEEYWHTPVLPYLYEGRDVVCPDLMVLGDIRTQLTAVNPVSGFESITGHRSGILGHPKLELRCIPTPHHALPKIMTTTGACTIENYTDSRAGKRGEFHHTLGATLIERDGEIFHMRQINALKNGKFQDLRHVFTPEGVEDGPPIAALVMGDTHVDYVDPDVVSATFVGADSMVAHLQPKSLVWHDLLDGYAVNPHTKKDPFAAAAKRSGDKDDIMAEIERCAAFLDKHAPKDVENVIVPSNHNDFLSRWMDTTDWRLDPVNARFYLETALAMVEGSKVSEKGYDRLDPFPYWLNRLAKHPKIKCVAADKSHTIRGIEVGMHGHLGPNGSRGSLLNISRIGVKSVIGHSHTPGIKEGATQVGTSSRLKLDYNVGPSSWLNTHCIIYENGKRSLVNIINGKWRYIG